MVRSLANIYKKSRAKHRLLRFDDYVKNPPASGYRGIHLIYAYHSSTKTEFNGLKIEIQLRSRQQHAWATAVETVDAFTGQALKGGRGKQEWQRFFALMGSYLAVREGSPLVPNTPPDISELQGEIVHYVNQLEVFTHLQSYRGTLQEEDIPGADYYLVELDAEKWETTIIGYADKLLQKAQTDYLEVEKRIAGQRGKDAVLVSVTSLDSLKRAYPLFRGHAHVYTNSARSSGKCSSPITIAKSPRNAWRKKFFSFTENPEWIVT